MVEAQFKAAVVASPRDVGEAEGRGEAYLTQDEFQAPYAHLHRVRCVYTAHRRLTTLSPLHVHVCMYAAHALYCTTYIQAFSMRIMNYTAHTILSIIHCACMAGLLHEHYELHLAPGQRHRTRDRHAPRLNEIERDRS
jgi:hypothetical protein